MQRSSEEGLGRFQDKHVKCVRDIFDDKKERSINYLRRETGSISATLGSLPS
uniref:Uncharacterized protein n=1 Tax=Brassica oleracea TaxID=3712 RepID=A0A3P6FCL6_BRAOL|nr:unnamed protein product [Brassica oleracea]